MSASAHHSAVSLSAQECAELFREAENHFIAQRLKECAQLCQRILSSQPDFAPAHYLMGALFKATGNIENALKSSDIAARLAPDMALFQQQRGHCLLMLGRQEEALEALRRAYSLDPGIPLTLLLLGNIYTKRREFDEALAYFEKARAVADVPEVQEHIGLCLYMKGDLQKAETALRQAMDTVPQEPRFKVHLGKLLIDMKRMDEAVPLLQDAARDPRMHEALIILARVEEMRGKPAEAIALAMRASAANPASINYLLVLGSMCLAHGRHAEAEQAYHKVLQKEPENIKAIEGYAKIMTQFGRKEEALHYIDKVLSQRPDDEVMRYYRAALSGERIENAPKEFVAKLFDEYAERFDEHLVGALQYNTPQVLADAIARVLAQTGRAGEKLSLLDLGCGTGLGAEALAAHTTSPRVGVDLSAKMIDKANEKKLYDDTAVEDVVEYMRHCGRRFDLVLAADVLVYIGDLEAFHATAANVLPAGGLLAYSIENGDDAPPYVLRSTARYGHARSYVESLAEKHGYDIRHCEDVVLRQDRNHPMHGYIVVVQRRA